MEAPAQPEAASAIVRPAYRTDNGDALPQCLGKKTELPFGDIRNVQHA